jgi:hypothetical protein
LLDVVPDALEQEVRAAGVPMGLPSHLVALIRQKTVN